MAIQSQQYELARLVGVSRRRWKMILSVVLAALLIGGLATFTQQKQYDSTVILLAGQGQGIGDVSALDAITKATQTLARMGTNRVVIEQAIEDANLRNIDLLDLSERVTSSVPVNTQQIEITVRDRDPERAALLANSIGKAFSRIVEDRAGKASGLSATVWQPAIPPEDPSSPRTKLNMALALLLGLFAGACCAVAREQLDTSWAGEEELENLLGVPVLAVVPEISTRRLAL